MDKLLAEGVEAIAVCLLNSFANPIHELMIKDDRHASGPGSALLHQLRGPARDQRVRAHFDHSDQHLCHADCRALSGHTAGGT